MTKEEIRKLMVKSENQNKKCKVKLFCFWGIIISLFIVIFGNIIFYFSLEAIVPSIDYSPTGSRFGDVLYNLGHTLHDFSSLHVSIMPITPSVFNLIVAFQLVIYFFVFPILNYSLCKIHLKISREESIKFSDFFNPKINFKIYIKIVVLYFFKVFSTLVCLIPLVIPCLIYDYLHFINKDLFVIPGLDLGLFLLSYLMIVPAIVHFNSYFSFYYILIDNPEMGVLEIFKKAKIIIKGHGKEYMKVWLGFFNIAVIIICLRALMIWYFIFLIMAIIIGSLIISLPKLWIPIALVVLVALVIALSAGMLNFKTFQANYYQYIKEKDDLK